MRHPIPLSLSFFPTAAATTLPDDVLTKEHSTTVAGGDKYPVTPPVPKPTGPIVQKSTSKGGSSDQVHPTTPAIAVVNKVTPSSKVPTEKSRGRNHGMCGMCVFCQC